MLILISDYYDHMLQLTSNIDDHNENCKTTDD